MKKSQYIMYIFPSERVADLEKVVNHPQAANSEISNVLKIAWFRTMDEQKFMFQMFLGLDEILISWLPSLYPNPSIFNFQLKDLHLTKISFIQPQISIFNSSSSILNQKNGIFDSKSPQNSIISDKMSASAACTACSFFQVWREICSSCNY